MMESNSPHIAMDFFVTGQSSDVEINEKANTALNGDSASGSDGEIKTAATEGVMSLGPKDKDLQSNAVVASGIKFEKLRVHSVLDQALASVPNGSRVLVAVCGPSALTEAAILAASSYIGLRGLVVDIHCESFR